MSQRTIRQGFAVAIACTTVAVATLATAHASTAQPTAQPAAAQPASTRAPMAKPATDEAAAFLPLRPLHTSGQFLQDDKGRLIVTHGVNAVYKVPPFIHGSDDLTADDLDKMTRLGITSVRLGLIWEGLEPCKVGSFGCATYDRAYMARYKEIARQLIDRGIYVLVDFHQDLYTDAKQMPCLVFFKCDFHGEGAPRWATNNDGKLIGPPTYPLWQLEYFLYPGVGAAFDHLINPANDWNQIQKHYRDAWKYVASQFQFEPGILGLDLFNEPWPGTIDPAGVKEFNRTKAGPFFQRLINEIRKVDTTHPVFYEPTNVDAFGKPYALPDEFDPRDPEGNLGLSYHVYCLLPGVDFYCEPQALDAMDRKKQEIAQRGIAGLLSEFGSSTDYDTQGYTEDLADTRSASWQYWQWKFWHDPTGAEDEWVAQPDGTLDQEKARQLARTYPQRIAADDPERTGREPAWCFTRHIVNPSASQPSPCANKREGHFSLRYDAVHPGTVTTIFAPVEAPLDAQHAVYPLGYRVTRITGAHVISPPNAERLQIRNDGAGPVTLELDAR